MSTLRRPGRSLGRPRGGPACAFFGSRMRMQTPVFCRSLIIALCCALAPAVAHAEGPRTGEQLYKQACARCHGATGEGTKKHFDHPLAGDKSADQLATYVAKTMPEDDPGSLPAEDARKVAAYVFDVFYSHTARV